MLRTGDFRAAVVEQAIAQEFLGECGMVLFLTMILQRMRPRYQDRSYRYGLLEAARAVGENVYLGATAMGLGAWGRRVHGRRHQRHAGGRRRRRGGGVHDGRRPSPRRRVARTIGTMLDFLRRDQPGFAAVHFAGTVAPPADAFERLRDQGYALTERRADVRCGRSAWSTSTHGTAEPPRVPRLAGHR